MRSGASSRAETIQFNGDVFEYQMQGNQRCYCAVHTLYEAIAYIQDNAVCRIPYEICRTGVRILPNMHCIPLNHHNGICALLVAFGISIITIINVFIIILIIINVLLSIVIVIITTICISK